MSPRDILYRLRRSLEKIKISKKIGIVVTFIVVFIFYLSPYWKSSNNQNQQFGDVLTDICSLAVWSDDTAVRDMVLIPLVVYLILGTAFWMAGFVSLCRIRKVMKNDSTQGTEKLEKLMIHIGVFSVLYTVHVVAQILCLVYEHVNLSSWVNTWHVEICQKPKYSMACPSKINEPLRKPSFEIFIAKYFVSLLVGLTSSVWIWFGKTLNSWQQFLARI